jgi:hypothetical protein
LTLAAIILGFTSYKTYNKYLDTRNKERAAAADATEQGDDPVAAAAVEQEAGDPPPKHKTEDFTMDQTEELSSSGNSGSSDRQREGEDEAVEENKEEEPEPLDNGVIDEEKVARRQFLLEQDSRQYPKEKLLALLVLWIGLILLTFFKGGKGVDSIVGITCASPWYAALIAIQFLWTLGFATFFAMKLIKSTEEKKAVGYPFHPQDVLWDFSKTRFYACFTFVAGVVAGLIGIGGGMVLGPLMLVMGIHPRVSSATTATMIVLTSSSVAILFVTAGLVPWQYAVCFFCVCFCGAVIGKTYIDAYVKRTGKASLLIFLLLAAYYVVRWPKATAWCHHLV